MFVTKDSGARASFPSGMVRDVNTGKPQWHRLFDGPLAKRYVELLTRGQTKYPDVEPGKPNWMLANGPEEYARARESTARHFAQLMNGETDEDHAAAVWFGVNLMEYIKDQLNNPPLPA